jgi:thioredoxin reductase
LGEEEFIKTKNQKPKTKNNLTIEQKVGGVELDKSYKNSKYLLLDGVFIEIGGAPGNELAKSLGVELDEKGYIKVGPDMATNVPGVFAAGDIANAAGELQQIVTAVSEGAIAATSAFKLVVDKER